MGLNGRSRFFMKRTASLPASTTRLDTKLVVGVASVCAAPPLRDIVLTRGLLFGWFPSVSSQYRLVASRATAEG
jgi:hypothetical protein